MTAFHRGIVLYITFILVQNVKGDECEKVINDGHYSCKARNLTYIPSGIHSSIKILDFSFNYLLSLHKSVFPRLYNLQVLDLTRCQIQCIADDAFHNVKNVTTLILTGNPVSYIGPVALNLLHKLHRLVLVDTGLSSLNVSFNNLTMLQELRVGTNSIQSMALPVFMRNFTHFCLLDLHANDISIIKVNHTAVLREMRRNITLILSRNPILYIEPGTFQNILLRELNIQGAFLSINALRDGLKALSGLDVGKLIIGNYSLSNMIQLSHPDILDGLCLINFKEIHFYKNVWLDPQINMFHCMANATKLTIVKSNIREMIDIPLYRLKELHVINSEKPILINLSHLHFLEKVVVVDHKPIFFTGFNDIPNLQHVDLSRNNLELHDCCSKYFRDSPNVRHLNLSVNSALHMNKYPFSKLGFLNLEILDLHDTHLSGISGQFEIFKNLNNLQFLDMSNSDITFLSTMTFGVLSQLKVLKIARNHFQKYIPRFIFENLTVLEILDISNCDIENIGWTSFRDLRKLHHLILSQNKLMALNFLTHPNLKSLMLLEVDTNNIASVTLNILQNLPTNLSVFDLSFNPIDCSCSQVAFVLWIKSHQQIFPQPNNILCKTLPHDLKLRVTDFGSESCIHITRLTIVSSIFAIILLVLVSVLTYRFQFYLQYGCILLRGYRVSRQQEYSYDAFVIYSTKDEGWVMDELVDKLENGIPPIQLCLHIRDFEAGKAITSNIIDEGIVGSRKIIVVVSSHFLESSWCKFEFEVAQSWLVMQGNANIIIIILEDVEEEKTKKVFGLHKYLKKNTYLKWSRNPVNNMRFWIRLRRAIIASK